MECKKNYMTSLFVAIVVMILPLFLSFHLAKGMSYSNITKFCFFIVIIICNISKGKIIRAQFSKEFLLLFIIFLFFQLAAVMNGYIINGFLLTNDVFNIIGKAIMIYTFIVIPSCQTVSEEVFIDFTKKFTILSLFICLFNFFDNYKMITNFFNISNSYQFNVTGVFANRNQLGSFMFISIIAHIYYNTRKSLSKLDYVIYIVQFVNLILSMSRAAMLATGIFLLFYIGIYKRFLSRHPIFTIIAICLICLLFTNDSLWGFIQNNIIRSEVGNSGRSEVWLTGIGIANNNISSLFIGQGLFHGISIAQSTGMSFDQFHSFYVDTLVSGGVVELLFLVALFVYIAIKAIKCSNIELKWVYFSSLIGYLTLCFFESDSVLSIGYVDTINTIFFVTIPILISGMKKSESKAIESQTYAHNLIKRESEYY